MKQKSAWNRTTPAYSRTMACLGATLCAWIWIACGAVPGKALILFALIGWAIFLHKQVTGTRFFEQGQIPIEKDQTPEDENRFFFCGIRLEDAKSPEKKMLALEAKSGRRRIINTLAKYSIFVLYFIAMIWLKMPFEVGDSVFIVAAVSVILATAQGHLLISLGGSALMIVFRALGDSPPGCPETLVYVFGFILTLIFYNQLQTELLLKSPAGQGKTPPILPALRAAMSFFVLAVITGTVIDAMVPIPKAKNLAERTMLDNLQDRVPNSVQQVNHALGRVRVSLQKTAPELMSVIVAQPWAEPLQPRESSLPPSEVQDVRKRPFLAKLSGGGPGGDGGVGVGANAPLQPVDMARLQKMLQAINLDRLPGTPVQKQELWQQIQELTRVPNVESGQALQKNLQQALTQFGTDPIGFPQARSVQEAAQRLSEIINDAQVSPHSSASEAPPATDLNTKTDPNPKADLIPKNDSPKEGTPSSSAAAASMSGTQSMSLEAEKPEEKKPAEKKDEKVSPLIPEAVMERLWTFLKFAWKPLLLIAVFYGIRQLLKLRDPHALEKRRQPKIEAGLRRRLKLAAREIGKLGLSTPEEVMRRYHLFLEMMAAVEHERPLFLPPLEFHQQLRRFFPWLDLPMKHLTETFCDVYYGGLEIPQEQVKRFRSCFNEVTRNFL